MTRLNDPTRTHPLSSELFTPVTDELISFLEQAHAEVGTWRLICERGGIKLRVMRRLRNRETTCVSMSLMDRIIIGADMGSLSEWLWFTPTDLIKLGVWKEPMYVSGKKRYYKGRVWVAEQQSPYQRELAMRRKAAKRRRAKKRKQRLEYKRFFKELLAP